MATNQDIVVLARKFFRKEVVRTVEGEQRLKRRNEKIQFIVTDGSSFSVTVEDGKCTVRRGQLKTARIHLQADGNTYQEIFEGKLTLTDAWSTKKLKFEGMERGREAFIWFLPLIRIGQGKYSWV